MIVAQQREFPEANRSARRIVFRADLHHDRNFSDVTRSLALAEMLRNRFPMCFAIQTPPDALRDRILRVCEHVLYLPAVDDLDAEAMAFDELLRPDDIVVLHGLTFDARYQMRIRTNSHRKLVYLAGDHPVHTSVDAVIHPSAHESAEAYESAPQTAHYLGPQYALLRAPFIRLPDNLAPGDPDSWFVFFGNQDPFNLAQKAAQALLIDPAIRRIHLNVADGHPALEALRGTALSSRDRLQLHYNLDDAAMCALMLEAGNALCGTASLAAEACAVGMRLFTAHAFERDAAPLRYFENAGLGHHLGNMLVLLPAELLDRIQMMNDWPEERKRQREAFGKVQADRLLEIFEAWA
ncbi:MAG: hypothetical protein AAF570_07165 [Bacteroidota bacterium]